MRWLTKKKRAFSVEWHVLGLCVWRRHDIRRMKDALAKRAFMLSRMHEPDRLVAVSEYWHATNPNGIRTLNVEEPRNYTEKTLWLRKYYFGRSPAWPRIEDKISFKDVMRERLGDGYTAKLYAVFDRAEDIRFDDPRLPNAFVLKASIGSFGKEVVIVKDKKTAGEAAVRLAAERWQRDNLDRKILVEEFLDNGRNEAPVDVKFLMARDKVLFVYTSRFDGNPEHHEMKTWGFYDEDWKKYPFGYLDLFQGDFDKPARFDEMLALAKILGKDFPFIRVDFYDLPDRIVLGELTSCPTSGQTFFRSADPEDATDWNRLFGDMITLPEKLPPVEPHVVRKVAQGIV